MNRFDTILVQIIEWYKTGWPLAFCVVLLRGIYIQSNTGVRNLKMITIGFDISGNISYRSFWIFHCCSVYTVVRYMWAQYISVWLYKHYAEISSTSNNKLKLKRSTHWFSSFFTNIGSLLLTKDTFKMIDHDTDKLLRMCSELFTC